MTYEGPERRVKKGTILITRQDAKELGLKRYFHGKPCVHGHVDERLTSNGTCVSCADKNSRSQRIKGVQKCRIRARLWRRKNPERRKSHAAKRRGAIGSFAQNDIKSILEMQKYKCANCRISVRTKYHIDHIIPISKGGTNYRRNIQIMCPSCNTRKHAKDPIKWATENGKLI